MTFPGKRIQTGNLGERKWTKRQKNMEITRGKWSHGNEGQPFVLPGIDFFISLIFCNLTTPSVTLIFISNGETGNAMWCGRANS